MFYESPHTTDSSSTPADVDRHRKRKMATTKPEIVISDVLQQIDTRFERQIYVLWVAAHDGLIADIRRVDRHSKRKMAVAKPELVVCRVLQQIDARGFNG